MPTTVNEHIRDRGNGDLCVGDTKVTLEAIHCAYQNGESPEAIRLQYPRLTLPAIYGAISWMLDHPKETAQYLQRQQVLWEEARIYNDQIPKELVDRIRAAKQVRS